MSLEQISANAEQDPVSMVQARLREAGYLKPKLGDAVKLMGQEIVLTEDQLPSSYRQMIEVLNSHGFSYPGHYLVAVQPDGRAESIGSDTFNFADYAADIITGAQFYAITNQIWNAAINAIQTFEVNLDPLTRLLNYESITIPEAGLEVYQNDWLEDIFVNNVASPQNTRDPVANVENMLTWIDLYQEPGRGQHGRLNPSRAIRKLKERGLIPSREEYDQLVAAKTPKKSDQ